MNVVDPHIKKEWLFHHFDGKISKDQPNGGTTWPSFACHWVADLVMVFSHSRKRSSMFIERLGEAASSLRSICQFWLLFSHIGQFIQIECCFVDAALGEVDPRAPKLTIKM